FVGLMDVWNRKFNTKVMHLFEDKIKAGRESFISAIQITAILGKLIRDFICYAVVFSIGVYLANAIYITLPEQIIDALSIAFWAMPAVGIAVVFDMFRTKTGEGLFAAVFAVTYVVFSFKKPDVFLFLAAVLTASLFVVYNSVWGKKEQ
ncbi:MAG TPA: PTS sugar transporter subunit IIC, partial [Candidatus Goldiibacteriota bacterium]|nr:PTS sugar transporter subunit IIC [Candidatus Goldiibacteriota bacterium]